jgi:endo-1,4-beta-D-glucanase Y
MEQIKEKQAAERDRHLAKIRAYKKFFGTDEGRIVLWDMMKANNFRQSTFSTNAHEMAFNEGRRSVILQILSITETDERKILDFFEKSIQHIEGDDDYEF